MLLFLFWLGGYTGLHHVWMGNKELALNEAKKFFKHVLMSMIVIGIPLMLMDTRIEKHLIKINCSR